MMLTTLTFTPLLWAVLQHAEFLRRQAIGRHRERVVHLDGGILRCKCRQCLVAPVLDAESPRVEPRFVESPAGSPRRCLTTLA